MTSTSPASIESRSLATAPGRDSGMKKRYLENSAAAAHDMRLLHEILARL